MSWNGTTLFGIARTCYIYCNSDNKLTAFVVNNSSSVMLSNSVEMNNSIPLCLDNRYGPLCSVCADGYSVVFGSTDCKQCSNWWLLTLIGYVLVGPLLIYLLYALKLTLTDGTLNGVIFYAQIVSIFAPLKPQGQYSIWFLITRGLVSLLTLTLNFNYPLCFYDGMNELWKSGLSLVFPIYLFAIVIFLIIVSRYSTKLSNKIADSSVQVLVTVVHLSFSRLLTSIIDVFNPTEIYINTTDTPLSMVQ